jgi:hypothetical protein
MADQNPTDRAERALSSPRLEDAKVERAVMAYMLQEQPILEIVADDFRLLTIPELSQVLNDNPGNFSTNDAVERAVRELVGIGLLECREGGRVQPTRAARYLSRLDAI